MLIFIVQRWSGGVGGDQTRRRCVKAGPVRLCRQIRDRAWRAQGLGVRSIGLWEVIERESAAVTYQWGRNVIGVEESLLVETKGVCPPSRVRRHSALSPDSEPISVRWDIYIRSPFIHIGRRFTCGADELRRNPGGASGGP